MRAARNSTSPKHLFFSHLNRQTALESIKRLKFSNAPVGLMRVVGIGPNVGADMPPVVMLCYMSLFTNDPPSESVMNATYNGSELRCPRDICYNSSSGLYWWGFIGVTVNFEVAGQALNQAAQ